MMVYNKASVAEETAQMLALFAVEALLDELALTPKPGLVDKDNNGAHHDLTHQLMEISAYTLRDCFHEMAITSAGKDPSQQLREQLAAIGRYGEQRMLKATGNINTHKGAIWALGLLTAAAAVLFSRHGGIGNCAELLVTAGSIAAHEDRQFYVQPTNGSKVRSMYKVRSAREEAIGGFPSLQHVALPAWNHYEQEPENIRRLNVLLSLMSVVQDTCILHRSNMDVLMEVQQRSGNIINAGGLGVHGNWSLYTSLDEYVMDNRVSPGGSADLLAATIFLQKIKHHYKIN